MEQIDKATRRYLDMVRALPSLDKEQELDLARRYKATGDRRLADRIVTANLRNVVPLAVRYRRYGLPLGDLISEGNAALMIALERFEPQRGLRFATYANHWVRAEMLNYVLRSKSLVEGGRGRMRAKYFFKLRREHAKLLGEVGHVEQVEALLAQRFELDVEEVRAILSRLERGDGSLDVRVGENQQTALVDTLAGSGGDQDEQVDHNRRQAVLQRAVREATRDLNERERVLVEQRIMADSDDERTLVDISKSFGVSRERARQLESNVKNKLRVRLTAALRTLDDASLSAAQTV